jgi:hypothetical protein
VRKRKSGAFKSMFANDHLANQKSKRFATQTIDEKRVPTV